MSGKGSLLVDALETEMEAHNNLKARQYEQFIVFGEIPAATIPKGNTRAPLSESRRVCLNGRKRRFAD
jgi:hypothetical protein